MATNNINTMTSEAGELSTVRESTGGFMKASRTQIYDLPEHAVELSDVDMRIVSGGLTSLQACYSANATTRTNKATGQDWDTDYTDSRLDTDFSAMVA
jgi:hypothetical protein